MEDNAKLYDEYFLESPSGKYFDTITVQANNNLVKVSYELWNNIYKIIYKRKYSLPEAREWLGQNILWYPEDIHNLD